MRNCLARIRKILLHDPNGEAFCLVPERALTEAFPTEQQASQSLNVYFPNASTCRPRRRRTIQNSSTVSKVREIEVAAAAPWPP